MWATGEKTIDERISQGPSSADNVPGTNLKTVLELAQKQGKKVGDVSTAEITDATPGRARLAHLAARLPGPGRHGRLPDGDEGRRRPRLDRRAGGRPQGRRAARRRPRPLRADDHRRPGRRQDGGRVGPGARATSYVTDAAGLERGRRTRANRCSASSTPATCRSSGPARPRRSARATRRRACTENQRPANEPSLAAMTEQGDRACSTNNARASSCRSRAPRSTSRTTPPTPAARSARRSPSTRRSASPSTTSEDAPGHAGRRHRRPLAHQPDRRRGRERHRAADRLLDQPADQGRPDADLTYGTAGYGGAGSGPGRRRRRASSTPARSCRSGASGPGALACSAPTTTRTCSRRWGADLGRGDGGGPGATGLPIRVAGSD